MQEKNDAAVLAEQEENEKKAILEATEKGFFQPNKERNHRGIYFPEYWRKKRLKCSFVSQLEETAKKTATLKDKHGEYKDGLFLYGCSIVKVSVNQIGLWCIEIHSDHPIGLPMIQEIRYKFVPNDCLMAMLLPSREERNGNDIVTLYQIPNQEEKE